MPKKLPEDLINKIAAGEVVESPVSVVKELVENSLDAKSTKVAIQISGKNLENIRIIDDGKGIPKEGIFPATQRHTTSKIANESDLYTFITMGFRGEALSSIAAVCKMSIESCCDNSGLAHHFFFLAGGLKEEKLIARNRGTTIFVEDLFFNTPARKAFQKSSKYLRASMIRLVQNFSLGFPKQEFSLSIDGKVVIPFASTGFTTFFEQLQDRCANIYGKDFVTRAQCIENKIGFLEVHACLGSAVYAKKNRFCQHIFINQRCIQSPFLSSIVKQIYNTRLQSLEEPSFVLHIRMDPKKIDVNVHPQKKEVRFQKPQQVREQLMELLSPSDCLQQVLPPVSFAEANTCYEQELVWEKKQEVASSSLPLVFASNDVKLRYILALGQYALVGFGSDFFIVDGKKILVAQMLMEKPAEQSTEKLLVPHLFEVSLATEQMVEDLEEIFLFLQIELRIMHQAIAIDAIPSFLHVEDVQELILLLAQAKQGLHQDFSVRLFKKRFLEKKLEDFCTKKTFSEEELRLLIGRYQEPLFPLFVRVTEQDFANLYRGA